MLLKKIPKLVANAKQLFFTRLQCVCSIRIGDELNAKLPVIAFIPDGGQLGWPWHYGHYILVTGYLSDGSIIYYDPWDGVRYTESADNFASAWGTLWRQNPAWDFLEALPTGVSSPLPSATTLTKAPAPSPTPTVPPGTVTEFPIPTSNSAPVAIVNGPDGNLWFLQSGGGSTNAPSASSGCCSVNGSVGRITPSGAIHKYADPQLLSTGDCAFLPDAIIVGPDSNLWYTLSCLGFTLVGHITPSGTITETYPTDSNGNNVGTVIGMVTGPDGNVWLSTHTNGIVRLTPNGTVTAFPVPDATFPSPPLGGIAVGSDGNLWFTMYDGIGRITPSGDVTEFPIDQSVAATAGIARGPDGNVWFAENNAIGRITPSGAITQFPLSQPNSYPDSITAGPDGNLWFTEAHGIGRITPAGVITVFPVSPSFTTVLQNDQPLQSSQAITLGPNGNLWFVDETSNKIGEITP